MQLDKITPDYFTNKRFEIFYKVRDTIIKAINDDEFSKAYIYSIIGCNANELKDHLEFQFEEGMNWDNFNSYWEISFLGNVGQHNIIIKSVAKRFFHYSRIIPKKIK